MALPLARAAISLGVAVVASTLGGCTFPVVSVSVGPNPLAIAQGQQGTVTVSSSAPHCNLTSVICPDVTGRTIDVLLQNVPSGVTYTLDRSLQSPGTPGLIRITFAAAPNTTPSSTDVVVHLVLDGRILGSATLALLVIPAAVTPSPAPVSIAAGRGFSVAALVDGTVRTWGSDEDGALGLGAATSALVPTIVPGLTGVLAVSAQEQHVLALSDSGHVWAWGKNTAGQVGVTGAERFASPVLIPGLQNVEAIATGYSHSLAVDRDGVVWTWGDHSGLPPEPLQAPVRAVPNLPRIRAVAAGDFNSFAVAEDGSVWQWGSSRVAFFQPRQAGLSGVEAIASGGGTQFAIDRNGSVWAWGDNDQGQLGDGTRSSRGQPAVINGLPPVQSISVNKSRVLALTRSGDVWEWGGDGDHPRPAPTGLTSARAVAAGMNYAVALLSCSAVWSWGENGRGQLGHGSTGSRETPAPIAGIGDDRACAQVALYVTMSAVPPAAHPISVSPGSVQGHSTQYFGIFNRGTTVAVSAEPVLPPFGPHSDGEWDFLRWQVDCSGTNPTTTVTLDRTRRCMATYRERDRWLLTVASNGGTVRSATSTALSCPPQCNAAFLTDTVVELTAANDNGFALTGWSGDCSGTSATTTVAMNAAKTCVASFRPYNLALTVAGSGNVFVVDTAFQCAANCTFEPRRVEAVLTATPAIGWRFDGWGGDCAGSGVTTSVSMTADRSCTAAFSRDPNVFFLTMIVEGGGSVTSFPPGVECSATCVLLRPAGGSYDLLAVDTSHSLLVGWFDDCAAGAIPINHVVIDGDQTCRVRFAGRPSFPVAEMHWDPVSPRLGQIVSFTGAPSYVYNPVSDTRHQNLITQYSWDFNADGVFDVSGGFPTGTLAWHAFQTTGPHEVRLRVEGGPAGAADDDVQIVNVLPPAEPLFGFTLNKTGTGHGTVTSVAPGILHCAETCNAAGLQLEGGQAITLSAVPDAQSVFTGWTGCDSLSPGGTQCTVTISADRPVTANFDPIVTNLTLTVVIVPADSSGVIVGSSAGNNILCAGNNPSSVCSQSFAPGSVVQVRPQGSELGPSFLNWVSGCDSIVGLRCNVTMNANRTVVARFAGE